MQSGFNIKAIESFNRRMQQKPARQRMTTKEKRKAVSVRRQREELEENLRLKRELEGF